MSQAARQPDLEGATLTGPASDNVTCKPTISAIDIYFDGRAQRIRQYPRCWRTDETDFLASLPALAPKSARIYLKEEDCAAHDIFAAQGTNILKFGRQEAQLFLQAFSGILPKRTNLSSEQWECAVARLLEQSGADRWNAIHRADRFDLGHLRNLINGEQSESRSLLVQMNVEASQLHGYTIPEPFDGTNVCAKKLYAGRLGGDALFWEKYAALSVQNSAIVDAFEATSYAYLPATLSDEYVFPLITQLEKLLCSSDSSVSPNTDDPAVIKTYIVLDYLRVLTLQWMEFLRRIGHVSHPTALTQSQHNNDIDATASLQRAVNDLQACVSYVLDRAAVLDEFDLAKQPASKGAGEKSTSGKLLLVQDLRGQLEYLARRSQYLVERSRRLFEIDSTTTSNGQAQSAARLTVVASIFLPLTLAASLLAMNVPAASIGRLWYDFAGLVICIGFISFAFYTAYRKLQNTKQSGQSTISVFYQFAGSPISPGQESDQVSEAILVLLLWGFPAVVVASFLAGMFSRFEFAVDALKYGLPILFAVLLACLAFALTRSFSLLKDFQRTVKFVEALAEESEESVPGSSAPTEPSLSQRPYNKDIKVLLASVLEAAQNIKFERPANPGKPMVMLVHHIYKQLTWAMEFDIYVEGTRKNVK